MNLASLTTAELGADIADAETLILYTQRRLVGLLAELNLRMGRVTQQRVDHAAQVCQMAVVICCEVFGQRPEDILGEGKPRTLINCRHAAMLLAHELLPESPWQEQAREFRRKGHGTIILAVRSARNHIDTDAAYAAQVATCRALLRQRLTAPAPAPNPSHQA